MEYLFFAGFSVLAAILFNAIYPRLTAMSWAQSSTAKTYAGTTAVTALAFFVVLLLAGFVVGLVDAGATRPPTA